MARMNIAEITGSAWALLFARLILGLIFGMAGWGKVFNMGPVAHAHRYFVDPYASSWIASWLLWGLGLSVVFVLETAPFLTRWPDNGLVAASFSPIESEAGRMARALGPAPAIIAPGVFWRPIVFETLAAGPDPERPVPHVAIRSADDLAAAPPGGAFWYVARRGELDRLRDAGFRCARSVALGQRFDDPAIARVAPGAEPR